jgi:hypothetical protein
MLKLTLQVVGRLLDTVERLDPLRIALLFLGLLALALVGFAVLVVLKTGP